MTSPQEPNKQWHTWSVKGARGVFSPSDGHRRSPHYLRSKTSTSRGGACSVWGIDDLDQAASSSPYALQVHALQALERLRPQRNALAHGRTSEDFRNSLGRAVEFRQLTVAIGENCAASY